MHSVLEYNNLLKVNYDVFLFDIWGVIGEDPLIYEGVVDAINKLSENKNKQVFFLSNAPRPRKSVAEKLRSWGIKIETDNVFTSGEVALNLMLNSKATLGIDNLCIYHLGEDRNKDILANTNYKVTNNIEEANILLLNVFRDEGEDINEFDKLLQQAANFSKEGKLKVICPNPDTIIPYNNDNRYCPGYFAKKITNLNADVIFTGKPHIEIYNELLKTIPNVSKDLILMIGDTLDTDILGANRAGIHSALVMTGNSRKYYNTKDSLQLQLQQITQKAKDDGMIPNFVIDISIKD